MTRVINLAQTNSLSRTWIFASYPLRSEKPRTFHVYSPETHLWLQKKCHLTNQGPENIYSTYPTGHAVPDLSESLPLALIIVAAKYQFVDKQDSQVHSNMGNEQYRMTEKKYLAAKRNTTSVYSTILATERIVLIKNRYSFRFPWRAHKWSLSDRTGCTLM